MIAQRVLDHLQQARISFSRHPHRRTVGAQQTAAAMHVSGRRVAKVVLVEADGQPWVAVLAAPDVVSPERLATVLGKRSVRLMDESEFTSLFPDCEPGAEPPLGSLYGLPVVLDAELEHEERIVFPAGAHDEALELRTDVFMTLERPAVGSFAAEAPSRLIVDEELGGELGG
ncbi:MAG TPA: YbaK/EbsC family protein [Aggregicoccus sp.]|nr:YbaK/EbsC family protein [Aggregicoccus sp.]